MIVSGQVLLCAGLLLGGHGEAAAAGCPTGECFIVESSEQEPQPCQPAAPTVEVRCAPCGTEGSCGYGCSLTSQERPKQYVTVPPVPLGVTVEMALRKDEKRSVNCVELIVDDRVEEAGELLVQAGDRRRKSFELRLPPGRHTVEARYRLGDQWSRRSRPIYLDVQFPRAPEIISISHHALGSSEPLPRRNAVTVTESPIDVRLANVAKEDHVLVYLDGEAVDRCRTIWEPDGVVCMTLSPPPGYYSLKVARVPAGCGHALASRPSKEVMIHYQPKDDLVWCEGEDCPEVGTADCLVPAVCQAATSTAAVAEEGDGADAAVEVAPGPPQPPPAEDGSPAAANPDKSAALRARAREKCLEAGQAMAAARTAAARAQSAFDTLRGAVPPVANPTARVTEAESRVTDYRSAAADAERAARAAQEGLSGGQSASPRPAEIAAKNDSSEAARVALEAGNVAKQVKQWYEDVQEAWTRSVHVLQDVRDADTSGESDADAASSLSESQALLVDARNLVDAARKQAVEQENQIKAAEDALVAWHSRLDEYTRKAREADAAIARARDAVNDAQTQVDAIPTPTDSARIELRRSRLWTLVHARDALAARYRAAAARYEALAYGCRIPGVYGAVLQNRREAASAWYDLLFERLKNKAEAAEAAAQQLSGQAGGQPEGDSHGPAACPELHAGKKKPARKKKELAKPTTYRFLAPAHFPRRDFGVRGEVYDDRGAVIDEGMEFTYGTDGKYNVRFRVSIPAVPTTLHLQFLLQDCDGRQFTVTLDPIRVEPDQESGERPAPKSEWIVRSGDSAAIARAYATGGEIHTIRREGSAQFGYGYAILRP